MANGGPKRKQSSHRPPKHHESLEIKKAKTEKNFDIKEEVKEQSPNPEIKPVVDDINELFGKHVLGKIKGYENFNHKENKYLSALEFSWAVDGSE